MYNDVANMYLREKIHKGGSNLETLYTRNKNKIPKFKEEILDEVDEKIPVYRHKLHIISKGEDVSSFF